MRRKGNPRALLGMSTGAAARKQHGDALKTKNGTTMGPSSPTAGSDPKEVKDKREELSASTQLTHRSRAEHPERAPGLRDRGGVAQVQPLVWKDVRATTITAALVTQQDVTRQRLAFAQPRMYTVEYYSA